MNIAFLTLGCKVNSYETEKMKLQFEEAGYAITSFSEFADVYVVNTCTVTNIADRKSRKMLHRARRLNPAAVVVAAGCYVDSARSKGEVDESVDVFLGNEDKEKLVEYVEQALRDRGINPSQEQGAGHALMSQAAKAEEHTRAYLKVQNGCNQYCTYCIIPYVRGPLVSKTEEAVIEEVEELAQQGCQEVVVTGIHLSSYGVDFQDNALDTLSANSFLALEGAPLLSLLAAIGGVEGIERIRLGSLEPRIITESFAQKLSQNKKVCPHFHLSLQSGCDATLQRMNRHYSAEEYLEKVAILNRVFSHPAITTDIIVGFPQESEEEFATTCAFAKKAGFAQIHVFKYSRRQGTIADGLSGQVPDQVKAERSDRLLAVEGELEQAYQSLFVDTEQEVLIEEISHIQGQDYLTGYNERYVRIAIPASEEPDPQSRCNTIATVRILGQLDQNTLLATWC